MIFGNYLLNLETLKEIDSQQMYAVYDNWADIAIKYYKQDIDPIKFNDLSHIVFAGMGGSGAIGDIFSSILSKTNIHVNVVKGYRIPKTVDSNTLVVSTSVSGNTKETLSVLDAAKKTNCKIISFSDGGMMEKYCNSNSIEHRQIQTHHSPRASFTAFLYSMLRVLKDSLNIKNDDILESIKEIKLLQTKISSKNLSNSNPSLSLAKWMRGTQLIYYPWGLESVATRFKNSLQENSKQHAMIENIIETCHNGIVSWEQASKIQPILIQGKDDDIKTKERYEIIKEFFQQKEVEYKEIISVNGSILTKIISQIYLLDYSTIYNAVLNQIDPSPVSSINFVKSRLA